MNLRPCAPKESRSQRFDLGPCSQDGDIVLDEGSHVVESIVGTYSAPFCLAKSADRGLASCLDVEREQVKSGAKIINWPCHKTKWNQLWAFGGDGSMYISIPFAHHLDKKMCLEASKELLGEVQIEPCEAGNPLQRFEFHGADLSD